MEIQTLELTEEDILRFHRYYVTSLYLEGRKSAVEIVGILYEQSKLQVTVSQIEKCIREWKLDLPAAQELEPERPMTPSDDSWVMIPPARASPTPTNTSYTPSDPNLMSLYTKRPLPSLPSSASKASPSLKADSQSRVRKRQPPTTDRLRAICHHGPSASDSHEVEADLSSIPDGPSQLELYVDDEQSHERLAVLAGVDLSSIPMSRSMLGKEGKARRHLVQRRRLNYQEKKGREQSTDRLDTEGPSRK
ncbi:hypothetical protein VTL71DRAFT_5497 [Oculimacula yallundae]|uniref:Clr5 domain-containing protein n=1 Tax=Oculimacula yallundae TaxID=86028 RepID=A0ABR4C2B0_9HELO